MEANEIRELILKYNEGQADPAEIKILEQLIESGKVDLTELTTLHDLHESVMKVVDPSPTLNLDDQFYAMLADQKRKLRKRESWSFLSLPEIFPRWAIGAVLLIAGFAGGYFLKPADNRKVEQLSEQITDLKEMMMLTLLENGSATDRLKAVNISQEMNDVGTKVTRALIKTLNQDENINVRLAALEALRPYVGESEVRTQLIQSITRQDSPLVQVALAELMAAIQEKAAVKELEKLLERDQTPEDVKKRIEESINIMI